MSVKPVAWMDEHGCTCNDDEKVVRGPGFDIPLYSASAPELAEALRTYISHYPAFRSKPVGAPGSQAREKQEYEIALEDGASKLLARITPK